MDRLRICFFFHCFDGGGAERMTVALANELCRLGHDVTLLLRNNEGPLAGLAGPEVRIVDMKLPKKGKLRKNMQNIRWLRYALRPGHFDVLLAVTAEMSQVAAVSTYCSGKRIPLISVVHNTLSEEVHSFQRVRELLFPVLNKRYDRVITVSKAVGSDYIRVCRAQKAQVAAVYNPVVDDTFSQRAGEPISHPWLREDRNFVTLVQAGRLCSAKNHRLMFEALSLLNQEGDYRLILLGDGELREELWKEAKRLELFEKIDFAGFVPNALPYLKRADVTVLSSIFEGLPTVLIEALAVGSRIVSTDCPSGPREILENGTFGVLVESRNGPALAQGIRRALENVPDKEALRRRALDFGAAKSAEGYLKVIRGVIEGV